MLDRSFQYAPSGICASTNSDQPFVPMQVLAPAYMCMPFYVFYKMVGFGNRNNPIKSAYGCDASDLICFSSNINDKITSWLPEL